MKQEESIGILTYLQDLKNFSETIKNPILKEQTIQVIKQLETNNLSQGLFLSNYIVPLKEKLNEELSDVVYEGLTITNLIKNYVQSQDSFIVLKQEEARILVDFLIQLLKSLDSYLSNNPQSQPPLLTPTKQTNKKELPLKPKARRGRPPKQKKVNPPVIINEPEDDAEKVIRVVVQDKMKEGVPPDKIKETLNIMYPNNFFEIKKVLNSPEFQEYVKTFELKEGEDEIEG